MNELAVSPTHGEAADRPFGSRLILAGILVIVGFLSTLGLWAVYAPITSALLASGVVQAPDPATALENIDSLLVEAYIGSAEIGQLREGSVAQIEPTSVNHRRSMPIEGRVISLSSNSRLDPLSGNRYYSAIIAVERKLLQQQERVFLPGMAVNVMIRSSVRSPVDYLLPATAHE